VTVCVKCFLKSKREFKGKKAIALYLGCTALILKIASLSEKKKTKLSQVLLKGGASLSLLFSSLITSSIPLREEHERRLSSYNEQQRKERAREEETTLFFCSFLHFYLRSKLWEEERRLICFLKGVLRWKFCKSFSI